MFTNCWFTLYISFLLCFFFFKWFDIEHIGVPHETYETFWHCLSEIHIVKQLLIDFHVYKMVWSRWDSALPWQMIEAALPKNKQKKAVTAVSFALWNKLRLSSVCWFPPLDWQTELPTCQIYEANQADSFFQPSFQWAAISMESSCSPSFTCSFEFTLVPYDIMVARGSDGDIFKQWLRCLREMRSRLASTGCLGFSCRYSNSFYLRHPKENGFAGKDSWHDVHKYESLMRN